MLILCLRDHGCYMFSKAIVIDSISKYRIECTVDDIRHEMGNFASSKNVPKLMSRMGQHWRLEDDIIGGAPHPDICEYAIFSDGAGQISEKFASLVAERFELKTTPSCFQVRFKGFKGVLCVNPLLDLKGRENIVFRKSQKKFEEDEEEIAELEVVKYSLPTSACLSRPLIMIS
ncbi:unnamed protein product [Dracunculus medinensis]|uniref:RNA-dependent RNA polymerase n=1 Tax=Dracunculus medinensis TaxID=318479 RepID=A0A0N4UNZ8_DRAME|nr:unnamed protein product [Dracunculus medinensis]